MIHYGIHLSLVALLMFGCASPSDDLQTGSTVNNDSGKVAVVEPAAESEPPDVASANAGAIAPVEDTIVIPGEKFGAVTTDTSRQELETLYGADMLSDEMVDVGEGMTEAATRIDLGTDYGFTVSWVDGDRTAPFEVRDIGSEWTMPEGIKKGTTFADLKSILGEFDLFGFGWDYGGTIMLEGTPLDAYKDTLFIRLQPDPQAMENHPEAVEQVMGDQLYSSTNPSFEKLDLTVDEIIVKLGTL